MLECTLYIVVLSKLEKFWQKIVGWCQNSLEPNGLKNQILLGKRLVFKPNSFYHAFMISNRAGYKFDFLLIKLEPLQVVIKLK